jgi:hypothetical protein
MNQKSINTRKLNPYNFKPRNEMSPQNLFNQKTLHRSDSAKKKTQHLYKFHGQLRFLKNKIDKSVQHQSLSLSNFFSSKNK